MKIILLNVLLFVSFGLMAQDIVGDWNNIDEDTGEINSVINVYKVGDEYFGKIIHIVKPEERDKLCTKCKGDLKNKPILGMHILNHLKKDGDRYSGGQIFDPKTGKEYRVEIWVDENNKNKLNVRGYIAFFYDTREWVRKMD